MLSNRTSYLIRSRAQALHCGLLLHLLQTQVAPSPPPAPPPFFAGSFLPTQEDVVLLYRDDQTVPVTHEPTPCLYYTAQSL